MEQFLFGNIVIDANCLPGSIVPYIDGHIQDLLLHYSACHHENLVPMPLPLNHSNIHHCILFSLMDTIDLCFRFGNRWKCCCIVGCPLLFILFELCFYSRSFLFDEIIKLCSSLYITDPILQPQYCFILFMLRLSHKTTTDRYRTLPLKRLNLISSRFFRIVQLSYSIVSILWNLLIICNLFLNVRTVWWAEAWLIQVNLYLFMTWTTLIVWFMDYES